MRPTLLALTLMLPALPALAQDCTAAVNEAYRKGFAEGVEAVNAQLGAVTAKMQQDVQAQVNAQLAQIEARRSRELEEALAAAQARSLAEQGPIRAEGMPQMPPLAAAPGGGVAPVLPRDMAAATPITPRPGAGPTDPASLPPGTTITITDPQNLPPELFRALMDYAAR